MDDYSKLDDATKEHVIAAVSVLANAKYPTTCGHPLGEHAMNAYEMGHCYRIAYRRHALSHIVTLFFVRRSDDTMDYCGCQIRQTVQTHGYRTR